MDRYNFCRMCGAPYGEFVWPRQCRECQDVIFRNAVPVSVCLQPISDQGRILGLAYAQRAIGPHIGGWALIGGHGEFKENVEQSARREFYEETMVEMGDNLRLVGDRNNGVGHLLFFCEADPIPLSHWQNARVCAENLQLDILTKPTELCFPLHTEMANRWFERNTI